MKVTHTSKTEAAASDAPASGRAAAAAAFQTLTQFLSGLASGNAGGRVLVTRPDAAAGASADTAELKWVLLDAGSKFRDSLAAALGPACQRHTRASGPAHLAAVPRRRHAAAASVPVRSRCLTRSRPGNRAGSGAARKRTALDAWGTGCEHSAGRVRRATRTPLSHRSARTRGFCAIVCVR